MKTLLTALAALLIASPVFADGHTTVEFKTVKLATAKADGKAWDMKIPLKKGSELPDIFVEVILDSKAVLTTPVQKDSTVAEFTGQSFGLKKGQSVIIKVWDKDAAQNDSAA